MRDFEKSIFPRTLGEALGFDETEISRAKSIPGKIFCNMLDEDDPDSFIPCEVSTEIFMGYLLNPLPNSLIWDRNEGTALSFLRFCFHFWTYAFCLFAENLKYKPKKLGLLWKTWWRKPRTWRRPAYQFQVNENRYIVARCERAHPDCCFHWFQCYAPTNPFERNGSVISRQGIGQMNENGQQTIW